MDSTFGGGCTRIIDPVGAANQGEFRNQAGQGAGHDAQKSLEYAVICVIDVSTLQKRCQICVKRHLRGKMGAESLDKSVHLRAY